MFGLAAAALDALHALFMVLQVVGLPLLFLQRWPRLTRAYALYAIVFIALNQLSRLVLGECFLTSIARLLWARAVIDPADVPSEWFTVRLAQWVFHLTPSHRAIVLAGQLLMLITAIGVLVYARHARQRRKHGRDVGEGHDGARPIGGARGSGG